MQCGNRKSRTGGQETSGRGWAMNKVPGILWQSRGGAKQICLFLLRLCGLILSNRIAARQIVQLNLVMQKRTRS